MSGFEIISERFCDGFCQKRLAKWSVKKLKLSESRAQRGRVFQFQRNELSAFKNRHIQRGNDPKSTVAFLWVIVPIFFEKVIAPPGGLLKKCFFRAFHFHFSLLSKRHTKTKFTVISERYNISIPRHRNWQFRFQMNNEPTEEGQ